MAYTLTIAPLLDLAGFYASAIPTLTGSVFAPPPPSGAAATSLGTATSPSLTLVFSSASIPPAGPSAVLVTDVATGGDFLRSGAVAALPPSPAAATAITIAALIPAATLAAGAAGITVPPTAIPGGVQALCGLLTAGTFIPLALSLGPATAVPGGGVITLAVTGTLTARAFFFAVSTIVVTATATVTAAPSGDPTNAGRILRVTISPIALSGVAAPVGLVLGPLIASMLSGAVESMVNGLIISTARTTLASSGLTLTPSAVFSARRVVIAGGGVALQLVLSDLFGPAVVAPPKTLAVSISPAPAANVSHTYLVTVTDATSGVAVAGASVTLDNPVGAPVTHATNNLGQVNFSNVALKFKRVVIIEAGDNGKPHREVDLIPPTLSVTAAGFNSVFMDLL